MQDLMATLLYYDIIVNLVNSVKVYSHSIALLFIMYPYSLLAYFEHASLTLKLNMILISVATYEALLKICLKNHLSHNLFEVNLDCLKR